MRERRRARNDDHHRRPAQQPCKRNQSRCRVFAPGNRRQGLRFGKLADLLRIERDESDRVALAEGENVFVLATGEIILVLYGRDVDDGARPLDLFDAYHRQSDVTDFPLIAQPGEHAHRFLDGNLGIDSVELVEVDLLDAEVAEAAFHALPQERLARVTLYA